MNLILILEIILAIIGVVILFIVGLLLGLWMDPVRKAGFKRGLFRNRVQVAYFHSLAGNVTEHIVDDSKSTFTLHKNELIFINPKPQMGNKTTNIVERMRGVPVLHYFEEDAIWGKLKQPDGAMKDAKLVYPRRVEQVSEQPVSPSIAAAALNEKLAAEKTRIIGKMESTFAKAKTYSLLAMAFSLGALLLTLIVIWKVFGIDGTTTQILEAIQKLVPK